MMKNGFYLLLKALFVLYILDIYILDIYIFVLALWLCRKRAWWESFDSIIDDVTDWTENKYNTSGSPIYQEVKATRQWNLFS